VRNQANSIRNKAINSKTSLLTGGFFINPIRA
jgi:hypothetical protein